MEGNKHTVYQWYSQLTPGGKTAVFLIGTGTALFIGYGIWNAVKQAKENSANLKESKDAVTTLYQLQKNGVKPTFTDAQFESWSNQIAQAFGGCGTDTSTLYSIFSTMNNDADLYKLIATYGTRSYDGCKWLFEGQQSKSLSAAISDELDASEKDRINGSLSLKGITFKFA